MSFSGPFEIHTDTAVSLSVKQAELLICLPLEEAVAGGPLGLLHVSALRLGLVAAAGLDRDPEITIFQLGVGQAGSLQLSGHYVAPTQWELNRISVTSEPNPVG